MIQCDERLPGCLRCEKYGDPCPGYDRGFKFVTAKPYRSRRQPKAPSSEDESQANSVLTSNSEISHGTVALGTYTPQSPGFATLNIMQCLEKLTDEISRPFPSSSGYIIPQWFLCLPSVHGQNETLDFAMKTFVAHHVANVTPNKQAAHYARSAYLEALISMLASEDWHRMMRRQTNRNLFTKFDDLVEEYFAYFTLCPRLVHRLYSLKEVDLTDPATLVKMSELLKEALGVQKKLVLWYNRYSHVALIPRNVLSSTGDALYPTVLRYSDVNSATIYCGYYSYMVLILIHENLNTRGVLATTKPWYLIFMTKFASQLNTQHKDSWGRIEWDSP